MSPTTSRAHERRGKREKKSHTRASHSPVEYIQRCRRRCHCRNEFVSTLFFFSSSLFICLAIALFVESVYFGGCCDGCVVLSGRALVARRIASFSLHICTWVVNNNFYLSQFIYLLLIGVSVHPSGDCWRTTARAHTRLWSRCCLLNLLSTLYLLLLKMSAVPAVAWNAITRWLCTRPQRRVCGDDKIEIVNCKRLWTVVRAPSITFILVNQCLSNNGLYSFV